MSKKILVVSDSHGGNMNLRKAVAAFGERGQQLEMLIHLGDLGSLAGIEKLVNCPVVAVRGNCDTAPELPKTQLVSIGNETVWLTHGHLYGCKAGTERMKDAAKENGAGIVLFGHTHIPLMENFSDIKVMNPGSITMPRQEGHCPTYMVITVEEDGHLEFAIVTM